MFDWAPFRSTKAAIKLHTLLDLRGAIPAFIHISDGKLHDVNVLDILLAEAGCFYIMDRVIPGLRALVAVSVITLTKLSKQYLCVPDAACSRSFRYDLNGSRFLAAEGLGL